MPRPLSRASTVAAVSAILASLAGCGAPGTPRAAAPASESRAEADAADIRRTLGELEARINRGDISFVDVFTRDAVIVAPDTPDVVGYDAIRALYAQTLTQVSFTVHFTTDEIEVRDDLAYERGSYSLKVTDKASGAVVQDVVNRHIHMMKRQPDGTWKTWRMMVVAAPAAAAASAAATAPGDTSAPSAPR
jgi:ketosteroid isomerase-like protein